MKWEKQGMFLYERYVSGLSRSCFGIDLVKDYDFYILDRMGMEDYIHRLYPEDDIDTLPDKYSDVYLVLNLDKLIYNDEGRSQTGEPMIDVMLRYVESFQRG